METQNDCPLLYLAHTIQIAVQVQGLKADSYNVLHLCTLSNTVLEHARQGDGVGETKSHQTSG